MAKRKRLTPARPDTEPAPDRLRAGPFSAPPIAQVSAEASASAALSDLSHLLHTARTEGRLLEALALDAIETGYLTRDRLVSDRDELDALKSSIAERGQTTAIEVTPLPGSPGRYGLISGWRRLLALRELAAERPDRFGTVQARIVAPDTVQAAYVAMVEENEVRVNLSPFERAHVVVRALEAGLFADQRAALQTLYANVTRSKRSKIGAMVPVVRAIGQALHFPADLSERLALTLARDLAQDPALADRICGALVATPPATSQAEADLLARTIAPSQIPARAPQLSPNVIAEQGLKALLETKPEATPPLAGSVSPVPPKAGFDARTGTITVEHADASLFQAVRDLISGRITGGQEIGRKF
jgi:ParB family chromosome partitioning protein